MSAALRVEYRKLVTTRLWWVLLIGMAAYMAFLGAVMAFAYTDPAAAQTSGLGLPVGDTELARTVYGLAPSLGYVFPAVVGALSVTSEYRNMTVTPTFLAEPRRGVVLVAKLMASIPVGLMFGLAGTAGSVLGGAPVLAVRGRETLLTDPTILQTLLLSVVALTVWCLVGVGFGSVLTHQVAAVVVLLAFTQFVEPLVRLGLSAVESLSGIARWLPGAAGEAIAGASIYGAGDPGALLTWWGGLLVLVGYGVGLAAIARVTTLRRDIT
ncbi:ABC transporter permease [Actinotalea sp.]|uniref:ABC transporter permease n=1 Tax=Actinotalea sp. TaxID=1872145 RepID=UPI00356759C9